MNNLENTIVLEPSTNTHSITGVNLSAKVFNESDMLVNVPSKTATVLHGEHGAIGIESKNVLKVVQKELNPVTQALQNAFD